MRLIVFDLDGTLAESKSSIDAEMATLLRGLLEVAKVAVISGGAWSQFERQLLAGLSPETRFADLSLLPTCGTKFYRFDAAWTRLYSEDLSSAEKEKIVRSLTDVIEMSHLGIPRTWGESIDDRGSQITFSALGQQAPLEEKRKWDPDFTKRQRMKSLLDERIPELAVRLGGMTSIDVTKAGIDKAYGMRKLRDTLGIVIEDMLFVGDALFPGGNDHPVKATGVVSIQVRDPNETKRVIEAVAACLNGHEIP